MTKAIIVVDMTNFDLDDKSLDDRVEKTKNIKKILAKGVDEELPVFLFEYLFKQKISAGICPYDEEYEYKLNPTINELQEVMCDYDKSYVFKKDCFSCFSNKSFKKKLKKCSLNDLIIMGCNASQCIKKTIVEAVRRDFNVYTSNTVLLEEKSNPELMDKSINFFKKIGINVYDLNGLVNIIK